MAPPRMTEAPTYRIDGAAFADLEGFYDEIESQLLGGAPWARTLDALAEVLRGEVVPLPPSFRLVWEHSDLSRRRLGSSGRGGFTHLLDVIAAHPHVELVLS
jgi:RNAse (barnase) inhibitor barstar